MTKEIKKVINHILDVSQRMVVRELPLISESIRKVNIWLWGIDYRAARKMGDAERKTYDNDKVFELEEEIRKTRKGA